MKNKKKMIVAVCDPYNSRWHYRGERVLAQEGTSPTAWVLDDGDGRGLTEREAHKRLAELICWADSARFVSDEDANDEAEQLRADFGENGALWGMSWYVGQGYYAWDDNYLVMREGEDSFREDSMVYKIEDYVG